MLCEGPVRASCGPKHSIPLVYLRNTMSAKAQLHDLLTVLGKRSAYFSYAAIRSAVQEAGLDLREKSLKSYLSEAVGKGIVHDAGRGWYSRLGVPLVLDTKPLRTVVRTIEKFFPLLDFTVWSTGQVNPWMHHLIGKSVTFVNAPIDALEAVGDLLKDKGYDVWVDPTGKDKRRFSVGDRTVVLRPLVSRAPANGHWAPVEALVVDLFMEVKALDLMDRTEFNGMVGALLGSGLMAMGTLVNYIKRRKLKVADMLHRHVIG